MPPLAYILIYSGAVVISALLGGYLPALFRLTHLRMQIMLSMVGGLMLGIALLHILPHSMELVSGVVSDSFDFVMGFVLLGLLVTFLLMRVFHFHQHGDDPSAGESGADATAHACEREDDRPATEAPLPPEAGHAHGAPNHGGRRLSWTGVALGLAVHTFIDGIAMGAAVMADSEHPRGLPLYGFGVFLAIVLHKPLDALSISSLMRATGWSERAVLATIAGFASACPLGALLVVLGVDSASIFSPIVLGGALAMSAGVFLCISLSDVLPELQFHRHHRLQLTAALLLGMVLAYGIKLATPGHTHHSPSERHEGHDHP
jgi:zinc and cadmium transporter